jgi:hypothetical protein
VNELVIADAAIADAITTDTPMGRSPLITDKVAQSQPPQPLA